VGRESQRTAIRRVTRLSFASNALSKIAFATYKHKQSENITLF